jgi:magnesium transporter
MINVFDLQNGRLNQVPITSREDLENVTPVWVDLTDPTDEERARVKAMYGVILPGEDEVSDIEATKRKTATCTCAPTSCSRKTTALRAS